MSTKLIINITGDSITGPVNRWPWAALGVTSVGDASAPLMTNAFIYYSGRMMMHNMAITGSHLAAPSNDVTTLRPIYVDPTYARKTFLKGGTSPRKYLYINAIGTNDGAKDGFATAALYAAAVAQDIVAAKTAGADYGWIATLIPRGDGVMTEPNRLAYNSTVRDSAWRTANGVDDYIDLASATHADPSFLPVNSGGNTTWFFSDNVHPQDALSSEMGAIALAKLNAFLATI